MLDPPTAKWLIERSEESPDGCWLWRLSLNPNGYGQATIGSLRNGTRRHVEVHRIAYEIFKGSIPDGLTIDHLCRVRHCVNPEHLEAVTMHENQLRGLKGRLTTHCPRGHEYTPENTRIVDGTKRRCRACEPILLRESRERRRSQS